MSQKQPLAKLAKSAKEIPILNGKGQVGEKAFSSFDLLSVLSVLK